MEINVREENYFYTARVLYITFVHLFSKPCFSMSALCVSIVMFSLVNAKIILLYIIVNSLLIWTTRRHVMAVYFMVANCFPEGVKPFFFVSVEMVSGTSHDAPAGAGSCQAGRVGTLCDIISWWWLKSAAPGKKREVIRINYCAKFSRRRRVKKQGERAPCSPAYNVIRYIDLEVRLQAATGL